MIIIWEGAGNIKYGDMENGNIEETGISKKGGELNVKIPQYWFVGN
jgi:hypothetical protein